MRDEPTAADLLETARAALMEEILPALPAERRYAAHLIAAAMAIAAREAAAGDVHEAEEHAALAALLQTEGDLEDLNRAFARAIRAGAFDAASPARSGAWRILARGVRAKVMENNPGYLGHDPG